MKNYNIFKRYIKTISLLSLFFVLPACAINPATGDRQFTALMSPSQENNIGAQEHPKIMASFGGEFENKKLEAYINEIGSKLARNTERKDVKYKFFVIDTPMVNAFAVPGGYIYISRGLLALANNEAELAAVLSHEIAHITARHSAERYSTSILTTLGASVLSSAIDNSTATQALNLGSNLYTKAYSRSQEHQADELGLRYLTRAGYEPFAMAEFLKNLGKHTKLQNKLNGKSGNQKIDYFATHPLTADRVAQVSSRAATYAGQGDTINQIPYFKQIKNMEYGDSSRQGFVRDNNFYHPNMEFTFSVPENAKLYNKPENITMVGKNKEIIIFDMFADKNYSDPYSYMISGWMKDEKLENPKRININGMRAATSSFQGRVDGKSVVIRLVAIEWQPNQFFRFQIAIPYGLKDDKLELLKETTYSFRKMTKKELLAIRPYHIEIRAASSTDDINKFMPLMKVKKLKEDTFRVLNGMEKSEKIKTGQMYKVIDDK